VGITSFGNGCAVKDNPGIYTRLAYYYDWIRAIVNENATAPRDKYYCDNSSVSCGCGYKNVELISSRIVGGEQAVPDSWSMVVSISVDGSPSYHFGGTIVNDSYILTAANFVDRLSPSEISVRAGVHNRSSTMGYNRRVDRIVIHPEWNASNHVYPNDIALLHIYPPLPLDIWKNVAQTCIPELNSSVNIVNYPPTGTHLAIVGWGIMQMTPMMLSDNLRQLGVFAMDNEDPICRQWIHDPRQQFCTDSFNSSTGLFLHSTFLYNYSDRIL
jgi:secreted trypsin-like serine protease